MADTSAPWRSLPPSGLYATISPHRCGWHVLLYRTGRAAASRLRSEVVARYCVEYAAGGEAHTIQDQIKAMVIAMYAIEEGVESECDRL